MLALYGEAISAGNFCEVNKESMDMEARVFGWTLYVLQMEGYIQGCKFQPPTLTTPGDLMGVIRSGLTLTPEGFAEAKKLLSGNDTPSRLMEIIKILADAGAQGIAQYLATRAGLG